MLKVYLNQTKLNSFKFIMHFKVLAYAYSILTRDKRISVWHISIYMAFLYLWVQNKGINPITITRRKIMELAHVNSIATYHKCIKQLQEFGYIQYVPEFNYHLGSRIFLNFDSIQVLLK